MTVEQTVAFVTFSVAAAGTPGPSNALLTATGANAGVLRGLPALLGMAAGMGLLMFVTAFGLGSVVLGSSAVLTAVRWGGAAVLCWMAWKIATARGGTHGSGRPIGFLGMVAFQGINPKAWLVSASAAAAFLEEGAGSALGQSLAFGLTFALVSLPSCFPWLAFGAVLQRFLHSDRTLRAFNGVMGVLLAASVILFIR